MTKVITSTVSLVLMTCLIVALGFFGIFILWPMIAFFWSMNVR